MPSGLSYLNIVRQHLQTAYLLDSRKTEEMLPVLFKTLATHMIKLEELCDAGEPVKLGKAGHAVKGALLNLGLSDLAEQALVIEQRGKSGDSDTDYKALILQLKDTVQKITREGDIQ